MSIEDGGLVKVVIEDAADAIADTGPCPCCQGLDWVSATAAYARGYCWVIYCGNCGKPIEEHWRVVRP